MRVGVEVMVALRREREVMGRAGSEGEEKRGEERRGGRREGEVACAFFSVPFAVVFLRVLQ